MVLCRIKGGIKCHPVQAARCSAPGPGYADDATHRPGKIITSAEFQRPVCAWHLRHRHHHHQ